MPNQLQQLLSETRRMSLAMGEVAADALAPLGVSAQERALLDALSREDAPVSSQALARRKLVSPQWIERLLSQLQCRGWICSAVATADSALRCYSLSPGGRSFLATIRATEADLLQRLGENIDEQTIRSTLEVLRRLRRGMRRPPASMQHC